MPDDLRDDELDDQPDDSNVVKQLRRQAREARDKAKQLEEQAQAGQAAQRELMFAKAGIPLDDPKFRYFIKGYDGDTSPDEIRREAQAAGLLAAPPPDPNAADLATIDRVANASQGATTPTPPNRPDLRALVAEATKGVRDPIEMERLAIEAMRSNGVDFRDE